MQSEAGRVTGEAERERSDAGRVRSAAGRVSRAERASREDAYEDASTMLSLGRLCATCSARAQEHCVPSTHTSAASTQDHWIQILAHSTPIHTLPPPTVQVNRTHTDWVIVEYTLNAMRGYGGEKLDTAERRALERLLRKLLLVPSRPAVTLVHTYAVSAGGAVEGRGGGSRCTMRVWVGVAVREMWEVWDVREVWWLVEERCRFQKELTTPHRVKSEAEGLRKLKQLLVLHLLL